MYSKIALNNVKRSFKDYTIYFLTLTFAVCIFYSFNSIGSQKAMLQMSNSQAEYVKMLTKLISGISVFVSVILGCLIIYANNFLIKKRKKELGIYMTLGMGKNKISKILLLETILIGAISLVAGLIVGIALSQGLSVFTIKLFEVSVSEYKFMISASAISKTILYFGIMFMLVMIFNSVVISKYKLIDMLNASKKNENIKLKNPIASIMVFVLGIVSLGVAYYFVNSTGLNVKDIRFTLSIVLGILGTFLFFFGLAGFILYVVQRSEKIYFKNLNIFVTRQIGSKINTNFVSMTLICLMLFLTISILSTGLSFKNSLQQGIKNTTPFDASGRISIDKESKFKNMEELFEAMNYDFKDNQKHIFFSAYYMENINSKDILSKYADKKLKKNIEDMYSSGTAIIKISDYNEIRMLNKKDSIILENNEVLITSNFESYKETLKKFINSKDKINIEGKSYSVKNTEVITDSNYTYSIMDNLITLVVPDKLVSSMEPTSSFININYTDDNKIEAEKEFSTLFSDFRDTSEKYSKYETFMLGYTKEQIYEENKGMSTTILYIGIYLGVIFLITSAAVLALQQLSEASDSVERYKSLKRIGATEKMINKTIFTQTLIYFMLPLALALVHSVVGIGVANDFIKLYGSSNIGLSSLITALIIVIIYGGYFYATYTGYKSIVKNSK
ncbi:ABC transporter permease [Clostridium gasigenes]|uniref:ABC transporter permease n=1 Tax=Clostridium gasigenes TaxID=94869 RepID=UPI001C0D43A8|nr:ABC transporter permease [Clostridium gasigenes]MBU3107296.1 ABC transporter permease [Clostridium gasigenes]